MKGTVSVDTPQRHAMQRLYTATGLAPGRRTLTVTGLGGGYLLVDGFELDPQPEEG